MRADQESRPIFEKIYETETLRKHLKFIKDTYGVEGTTKMVHRVSGPKKRMENQDYTIELLNVLNDWRVIDKVWPGYAPALVEGIPRVPIDVPDPMDAWSEEEWKEWRAAGRRKLTAKGVI